MTGAYNYGNHVCKAVRRSCVLCLQIPEASLRGECNPPERGYGNNLGFFHDAVRGGELCGISFSVLYPAGSAGGGCPGIPIHADQLSGNGTGTALLTVLVFFQENMAQCLEFLPGACYNKVTV